jgi:hypothetical protein
VHVPTSGDASKILVVSICRKGAKPCSRFATIFYSSQTVINISDQQTSEIGYLFKEHSQSAGSGLLAMATRKK